MLLKLADSPANVIVFYLFDPSPGLPEALQNI